MNEQLYKNIATSTAHRPSRDKNAKFIFDNPALFTDLLNISFDLTDKNHHKACWILELVVAPDVNRMSPYLEGFSEKLPQFSHDGAVRTISKICLFAAVEHVKKTKSGSFFLNQLQQQRITESCFDWLIGDYKVATKAYAARALFELGKYSHWIYPELAVVLESGFGNHSAAYKVVAKEILKAISKKSPNQPEIL